MSRTITFNFSHHFDGVIWNTKASDGILVIESRNSQTKQVSFAALDIQKNKFLWKGLKLEEPWWVNLAGIAQGMIFFTLYTDTNNPDKKAILVHRASDGDLVWWNNDFSLSEIFENGLAGVSDKYGRREIVLDIRTGKPMNRADLKILHDKTVVRPQQFVSDHTYFETVKTFFTQNFNLLPTTALEYLEHDSLIFISCYFQEIELANYLFILSTDGNLLLKERLDEHLKGIGLDTFFILSGYILFVKDKTELVSYKIV